MWVFRSGFDDMHGVADRFIFDPEMKRIDLVSHDAVLKLTTYIYPHSV